MVRAQATKAHNPVPTETNLPSCRKIVLVVSGASKTLHACAPGKLHENEDNDIGHKEEDKCGDDGNDGAMIMAMAMMMVMMMIVDYDGTNNDGDDPDNGDNDEKQMNLMMRVVVVVV